MPSLPSARFAEKTQPIVAKNTTEEDLLFFESLKQEKSTPADYTLILAILAFIIVVILGVTIALFVWK